ncbi:MAG: PilZ domain-containing protein [Deltaproteobacteria bacterium]|nr:PilZ domain-containing protein [Deltaproteobacteria bacterium]MBW2395804.1 PilZ domain-containing protein [Deltaproteobacteria bacterium]
MVEDAPEEIQTFVDRRHSDRAPVTVRIAYETVDSLFSEFTRNINEGGVFIETEQPLGLEEQVQLQFQLPGDEEPVKLSGRVVRVESSGMGIEFGELDAIARERINQLVVQLRTDR